MRKCRTCKRNFIPSSGHLDCPRCRNKKVPRVRCPKCGGLRRLDRNYQEGCQLCSQRKEKNGNWKGGKTYHKGGYRMVAAPGHPRTTKTRYVFEHILVMEKKIGRYLTEDETVHHKNGVRDDNRLCNLELWTTNHPAGTRTTDLVKWAKELLKRYCPDALK